MVTIIKFLNKIDLQKFRVRAVASGVLVIIILLFDIHRFGAWYSGNRCHIKTNGLIMLFIAGLPFVLYTAAKVVQKLTSKGWYASLYILYLYPYFLIPAFLNEFTVKSLSAGKPWYDQSVLNGTQIMGIAAMLILAAVYAVMFYSGIRCLVMIYKLLMRIYVLRRIAVFFGCGMIE